MDAPQQHVNTAFLHGGVGVKFFGILADIGRALGTSV